ncbi:hypothetical protein RB595_009304 [Gaeumannomyces hyphopodioides]
MDSAQDRAKNCAGKLFGARSKPDAAHESGSGSTPRRPAFLHMFKEPAIAARMTDGTSTSTSLEDIRVMKTASLEPSVIVSGEDDDAEIQEILKRSSLRVEDKPAPGDSASKKKKGTGKSRDLVFTRTYSTFDRNNEATANSPFHGFFTLFWMAVFLAMVKMAVENWKTYGSPLGRNEIMSSMFRRDVAVLLAADAVMCGLTGVCWLLQRAVLAGYLSRDKSGWIIQNVWQTLFIAGVVILTLVRNWPWSHTVFFVIHGIVMLMKQHSYAFYNGHLSTAYKNRADLILRLERLAKTAPARSPSSTQPSATAVSTSHLAHPPSVRNLIERRSSLTPRPSDVATDGPSTAEDKRGEGDIDRIAEAIKNKEPMDADQVGVFEKVLRWEVDALTEELKGKATASERAYPNNLTLWNQCEYNLLPTLVYELEYPRSHSVSWAYVAEKIAATVGIIFVMIMISQSSIYPVVMKTIEMKEMGVPLPERFRFFPWMLSELLFPFMLEYLLVWYLIWETILNGLGEACCFADRNFYGAWWNSVSWDQFARDWNRPVHNFLLRHVYHSSISALKVNKHTATFITFFLSALVHELVMWCIFKKLRGYLLVLQMCQVPLMALSRTRWLRDKATLGNMVFWFGIFTCPSVLCSLYLIL